jgi:hypothetical protein
MVMKSRRMSLMGYVAWLEKVKSHTDLVRKLECRRPACRWEIILK